MTCSAPWSLGVGFCDLVWYKVKVRCVLSAHKVASSGSMITLRRVRSWLPLLQLTSSSHRTTAARKLHTPAHAAAVNTLLQPGQRGASTQQSRPVALSACKMRSTDDFTEKEEDEEDEDFLDDSVVEELFQQQVPANIGDGQHRVFIVHPDVKWGSRRQYLTTGNSPA